MEYPKETDYDYERMLEMLEMYAPIPLQGQHTDTPITSEQKD